jgi:hypothetical protein
MGVAGMNGRAILLDGVLINPVTLIESSPGLGCASRVRFKRLIGQAFVIDAFRHQHYAEMIAFREKYAVIDKAVWSKH